MLPVRDAWADNLYLLQSTLGPPDLLRWALHRLFLESLWYKFPKHSQKNCQWWALDSPATFLMVGFRRCWILLCAGNWKFEPAWGGFFSIVHHGVRSQLPLVDVIGGSSSYISPGNLVFGFEPLVSFVSVGKVASLPPRHLHTLGRLLGFHFLQKLIPPSISSRASLQTWWYPCLKFW